MENEINIEKLTINTNKEQQSIYQDKLIHDYVHEHQKKQIKDILTHLIIYSESNDLGNLIPLLEDINYLFEGKNFQKSHIEIIIYLLDKVIANNFKEFSSIFPILKLFKKLLSIPNLKIVLDWKVYYKLYYVFANLNSFEFSYIFPNAGMHDSLKAINEFFKKASKFFKLKTDDYQKLKGEILLHLNHVDKKFSGAISSIDIFIDKTYIGNDKELQEIMFKAVKGNSEDLISSTRIISIFRKVINKELKVDHEEFIEVFFGLFINFILAGFPTGITLSGVNALVNKKKKQKGGITKCLCKILSALLFEEEFKSHSSLIDRHFRTLIEILDISLNENTAKDTLEKHMKLLKEMLISFKGNSFKKEKIAISELEQEVKFVKIETKKDRLNQLFITLEPLLIKSLFYAKADILSSLEELEPSDELSAKIFETLVYLYENSDNDYASFIHKIKSFIRVFLTNMGNKKYSELFEQIIKTSIDKISSVSLDLNMKLLNFFNRLYLICNNLKAESKDNPTNPYKKLFELLSNSGSVIIKKFIDLFQSFDNLDKQTPLLTLVEAICNFIPETEINKIIDFSTNYIEENILTKMQVALISRFISSIPAFTNHKNIKNKYAIIWDYCYNNLVIKTNDEVKAESHMLVGDLPKIKIDLFNRDKLRYIGRLLKFVNFSHLARDEKFKIEAFALFKCLFNEKDIEYQNIALKLLKNINTATLLPYDEIIKEDSNNKIINFAVIPNSKDVSFVSRLFNEVLLPYLNYFDQGVNNLKETFESYLNSKEKTNADAKEKRKLAVKFYEKNENLEKNITLLLRLMECFLISISNPLIAKFNNEKFETLSESYSEYIKINEFRNNLLLKLLTIHTELNQFKIFSNQQITKYYIKALNSYFFDSGSAFFKVSKAQKKYLKNLKNKEKNLCLDYHKVCQKYFGHIRILRYMQKRDDDIIIKLISTTVRLSLDITEQKLQTLITQIINNSSMFIKISDKEYQAFYKNNSKSILKILDKIHNDNNSISITNKTRITNMFWIFNTIAKVVVTSCATSKVTVLWDSIELISKATEKKVPEIINNAYVLVFNVFRLKYDLPKSFYLFDKKWETLPSVPKNLKHESLIKNEKLMEKITKNAEAINNNSQKLSTKSQKLSEQLLEYYKDILKKLKANAISQNLLMNYLITINAVMGLAMRINLTDPDEYALLNDYEEYFFMDLLSDSVYLQKNISFHALGIIWKLKYKLSKSWELIPIQENPDENTINNIILNSKDKALGLNKTRIKSLEFIKKRKYNDVGLNSTVLVLLQEKENVKKLFSALIALKDIAHDQKLQKHPLGGILSMSQLKDNFQFVEAILLKIKNVNFQSKYSSLYLIENTFDHLFSYWDANVLFYLSHLYKFSNFDLVTEIFNEIVLDKPTNDQLVSINVALHFRAAFIKSCLISQDYEKIRAHLFSVMELYTYGSNKKIDNEMLNYFTFILQNCSVNDFKQIVSLDTLFTYNSDFITLFLNLLKPIFSLKSVYLFADSDLDKVENLIFSYLNDNIQLLKNLKVIQNDLNSLITMRKCVYYDFENLSFECTDLLKSYLQNILIIGLETKEAKQLMCFLFSAYKRYLVRDPELAFAYIYEISKLAYLNIDDFEKYFKPLRNSLGMTYDKINLNDSLEQLQKLFDKTDNLNSKKQQLDMVKGLIKNNITKVRFENLLLLYRIINPMQYEIKEYMAKDILFATLTGVDEDTKVKTIELLKKALNNDDEIKLAPISVIFILSSYLKKFSLELPVHIQDIIVYFNELNKKVFKNRGTESKLIKSIIQEFFDKYKYTYAFAKKFMSEDCVTAVENLSRTSSYYL
jgi:ribosomal protein S7